MNPAPAFVLDVPVGPLNHFVRLIGSNPPTALNPQPTAFVGPFAAVIGDVRIGANVFIAPSVTLRADEGTPFSIGANTNLQDGVILHGLKAETVRVNGEPFSIFIGEGVTCAHGALVHGPCFVGNGGFIGFKSIVFNAVLEEGVYVGNGAVVTNGARVGRGRFVPPGAVIDSQAKSDALRPVPESQEEFAHEVQRVNREFPAAYSMHFGSMRCSCGLACERAR